MAIDSVTYEAGVLKAVELRFRQHSEGATPASRPSAQHLTLDPTKNYQAIGNSDVSTMS